MTDFVACPCCGYPTLGERGAYEVCTICWWEDETTAFDTAPNTISAANHEYTLTQARANFADHFDMYDAGKGIGAVANPSPTRKSLLAHLAAVKEGSRAFDARALHGLLRSDAEARRREER